MTYADGNIHTSFPQITSLRARGCKFLKIPDTYYDSLRQKLRTVKIKVTEDLDTVGRGGMHAAKQCVLGEVGVLKVGVVSPFCLF